MSVHRSRRVFLVIRTVHAGCALGGSREDTPTGNTPTGTYSTENERESSINLGNSAVHAIGIFGERIDHELLILCFPPSVPWILADDRLYVVLDVLQLAPLVM